KLEEQIKQYEENMNDGSENSLLKEEVTEEEISSIVSKWTGIPVHFDTMLDISSSVTSSFKREFSEPSFIFSSYCFICSSNL
ncbi:hypothetical protein BGV08_21030, partial [Clostridioides difficile]|uniref:hypothetical protein n=1 Tax=Clostridioides difficile TaxID=1496 RepID=UPI000BC6A033